MDCKLTTYFTKNSRALENVRVRCVTVSASEKSLLIELVYPEGTAPEDLEASRPLAQRFFDLPETWTITILAIKSRPTPTAILDIVKDELNNYPSAVEFMTDDDISVRGCNVEIGCDERVYAFLTSINFDQALTKRLNDSFCEIFTVALSKTSVVPEQELEEMLAQSAKPIPIEEDFARTIKVKNIVRAVGEAIDPPEAMYIKDINYERNVIVCGKVAGFKKLVAKKTGKPFHVFRLTDFTGSVEVVYFTPQKYLTKIEAITDGTSVIVFGRAQEERDQTSDGKTYKRYKVVAKDICFCDLPLQFEEVIFKKEVPEYYKLVCPEPYKMQAVQLTFGDLLQPTKKKINPYFENKTIIVFDLETTGTDKNFDRITEIGAIKIVNGVPTEVFETLVNPEALIPENVTQLTGISNLMVSGKPTIEEVIGDFYRFTYGAILVAHNVQFDISFVRRFGEESGYYFENTTEDTLTMSREVLPRLKNYNLASLADYFDVFNKGAHRALNDCDTLMEIFFKLIDIKYS